jgi:hypothetical protein
VCDAWSCLIQWKKNQVRDLNKEALFKKYNIKRALNVISLLLIYLCYIKEVNMNFQYGKVCMKQVPLKVSVRVGYSTISLDDWCLTFGDIMVVLSAGVEVCTDHHAILKCQAAVT